MRALARANYYEAWRIAIPFQASEDLLRALVAYISDAYNQSFSKLQDREELLPSVREVVVFILDDTAGGNISDDHLWPQLWAMQQVEPLISNFVRGPIRLLLLYLDQGLNT